MHEVVMKLCLKGRKRRTGKTVEAEIAKAVKRMQADAVARGKDPETVPSTIDGFMRTE